MACALRVPYDVDEYDVAGGLLQEPLRLTPPATWGDEFLVPVDAEISIEGEILPRQLKPEGPFGEWPGYYSGQQPGEVFRVTAITHRRPGPGEHLRRPPATTLIRCAGERRRSGGREAVPRVRGVCVPYSGHGFICYISIDKVVDGEPKPAAMAVASIGFFKLFVVVDADGDPFNEEEDLRAVAMRTQPHRDMNVVRGVAGAITDEFAGQGYDWF